MKKCIKIISLFLTFLIFYNCNNNAELNKFTENLGIENKKELDFFISKMEKKLEETYKEGKVCENYKALLKDISSDSTDKIIKFDSTDLEWVIDFIESELEDQYNIEMFDSVYYDKQEGGIVAKNNENYIVINFPSSLLSDENINKEIKRIKKYGIADELIKEGKLWKTLKANEMKNTQVEEFFKIRYPSFHQFDKKVTLNFLLKPNTDYQNIFIKSIIFYDVFMNQIRSSEL